MNFNRLFIPGDQTKTSMCLMAAYLLCRFKHFCMLFLVASLSLPKILYVLHKAGSNGKSDNMISVM